MISGYTSNLSVQILIDLLKKHNVKKIIISPGTTNLEFTSGLQYNKSFELFSAIDERSAAYMACGMATESGEKIVITCTEATASRDYFPGITEAFYRKLPIIVVTGVHRYSQIGHLFPQIIDRSISPIDTFVSKVQLPVIKDKEDIWETEIKINKAILDTQRNGGGPVHIDLPCCDEKYDFSVKRLYDSRYIERIYYGDEMPTLPIGDIVVFIGAHKDFTKSETELIDNFCEKNNAVVFCDHASGYYGYYGVHMGLISFQKSENDIFQNIKLLIHIGEAAADSFTQNRLNTVTDVWRISSDGELRDPFKKLTKVFQMDEKEFFICYANQNDRDQKIFDKCVASKKKVQFNISSLPLSNVYLAMRISKEIPNNSYVYLGVSNTIRAWTLTDFNNMVKTYSNVGCRGIDGVLSTFIGGSLVNKDKLHFCVIGDLTFFYDLNVIGNREIKSNVRILLINNNGGGVFKLEGAPGRIFFGNEDTDKYIAAANHFGPPVNNVAKVFVESLGFEYYCANSKEELEDALPQFLCSSKKSKPCLLEVFTTDEDDRKAFEMLGMVDVTSKDRAVQFAKHIIGEKTTQLAKNIIKK